MSLRALFMREIEAHSRTPYNSLVWEPRIGTVIIVVLRQAFLDSFSPCDGIYVGGEPLGPAWGDPFVEDLDGWPLWVAEIRWKRIPKQYLVGTLREVGAALGHPRLLN